MKSFPVPLPLIGPALLALPLAARGGPGAEPPTATPVSDIARARQSVLSAPLSFEPNRGQTDPRVRFVSRRPGHTLFLTKEGGMVLATPSDGRGAPSEGSAVRIAPEGGRPAPEAVPSEPLPGRVNYVRGADPERWALDIPTYRRVEFRGVYPGIDLIYHPDEQGRLEYDYRVAPGSDPESIRLAIRGARSARVDHGGDLVLETAAGELRHHRPLVYQEAGGIRRPVEGGYTLLADAGGSRHIRVGFRLGRYDRSRDLVIDPTVLYSTYLGGSGFDLASAVAVDHDSAYVAGATTSTDFPGADPPRDGRGQDAFVARLSPGGQLVWATYLGGTGSDAVTGIAVHGTHAYVTGETWSRDFPVKSAFQKRFGGGGTDGFVVQLSPKGVPIYSTYFGGVNADWATGIALEGTDAYVSGVTLSRRGFPLVNPFQSRLRGAIDGFVARLSPGGEPVFSTYLGGTGDQDRAEAIAVQNGDAYVTGWTDSTDFPLKGGSTRRLRSGDVDAFVTRLSPGGRPKFSTFFGGDSGGDYGWAITVDGDVYIAGGTSSARDFPLRGAAQSRYGGGGGDAFMARLSPGGGVIHSTYLGGEADEYAEGIAVDRGGAIHVAGVTFSARFPVHNPVQRRRGGGVTDAFVTKYSSGGTLNYSSYFGGSGVDAAHGVAVDTRPKLRSPVFVVGETGSADFRTENAFEPSLRGPSDAFAMRLTP
jgi:hypothetical protein